MLKFITRPASKLETISSFRIEQITEHIHTNIRSWECECVVINETQTGKAWYDGVVVVSNFGPNHGMGWETWILAKEIRSNNPQTLFWYSEGIRWEWLHHETKRDVRQEKMVILPISQNNRMDNRFHLKDILKNRMATCPIPIAPSIPGFSLAEIQNPAMVNVSARNAQRKEKTHKKLSGGRSETLPFAITKQRGRNLSFFFKKEIFMKKAEMADRLRLLEIENSSLREELENLKSLSPSPKKWLQPQMYGSKTVNERYQVLLRNKMQEYFYVILLDTKNRITQENLVSIGTLNMSLVHPREVFAPAIEARACSVILVHNHPSGDPTPSYDDMALTERLVEVGKMVGIEVLDHIVIGETYSMSLKELGVIK
jgi:DNA repair protein RadC